GMDILLSQVVAGLAPNTEEEEDFEDTDEETVINAEDIDEETATNTEEIEGSGEDSEDTE
ncbi:hypothetical protein VB714_15370, partial [Spirulina sp. 06S082]